MDTTKIKEWIKSNPKMSAVIGLILFMFIIRGCSGGHSTSSVQEEDMKKNRVTITALEEMREEAGKKELESAETGVKNKNYLYERALDLALIDLTGAKGEEPKLYATLSMPDRLDYSAYKSGILVRKVVVRNFAPCDAIMGTTSGKIAIGVPGKNDGKFAGYGLDFNGRTSVNDSGRGALDDEYVDYCVVTFDDMKWEFEIGRRIGILSHCSSKLKGQIEMEVVPEGIRIRYVDDGKVLKEYVSPKQQPAIRFSCYSNLGSADVEYYR